MINAAVTLKMRMVNAEISQFSVLRRFRQQGKMRGLINLIEMKSQKYKDAQLAVKAEQRICSQRLPQPDSLGFPVGHLTSTTHTHPQDNAQLDQLKAWVSMAEGCLSHVQAEGIPTG
jgi:hypothetical protein